MIFRTIKDDITGANKSIGLFGLSLKDIDNKIYEIKTRGLKDVLFNTSSIDFNAIETYNSEILKGATAQDALTTASKGTNKATIALMESAKGTTISTEQMIAAQKASTLAAKAQSAAYKAVSVAANMIAFSLIAKGIQLAADAIDHYVNRAKYAAEAMEEAQQKIDDAQSTLKTLSDTLSENKDRFLELSQGVDKFSHNLSLSEEDYAEYLSISNKLAELSPSLVSGYDDQGNALLAIGKNAEETNEKLQSVLETQQAVAQQTLIDNMDDVAEGIYYEVEKAKNEINLIETELNNLSEKYKTVNVDIKNSHGVFSFNDLDYSKYGSALEKALTSAGIKFEKNSGAGLYTTDIQLVGSVSFDQMEKAQEFYDAWLETENEYYHASENGLKKDLEEKKKSIEVSYSKMTANLQAWVKDNYNYQYLSDTSSAIVDALVPEIKWSELEEPPTTAYGYQSYVEDNIIKPLMEIPSEYKSDVDRMFQELLSYEDGDLNVVNFAEELQSYLDRLYEEGKISAKIDLTPIFADEKEAKDKLQNSIGEIAGDNSEDYKKLQDYTKDFNEEQANAWLNATLGANNATDAIDKYEKSLEQSSSSFKSFTEAFNAESFADSAKALKELAKAGELTPETIESTKEYKTLLKETGLLAEEATSEILNMLTAQEKLSAASQGLDKLSNSYEEFKDIGFVTASTLESLPDVFKNLPSYNIFSQIVGDPQSGVAKIQQAFDNIVKDYLITQDTLTGLLDASESQINSYVANLKQMGVENAQEVVNQIREQLKSESDLFNKAEEEYVNYLNSKSEAQLEFINSSGSYNSQLIAGLGETYKTDYDNWVSLLEKKTEAYNKFVEAIGGSYDENLSIQENMLKNGSNMSANAWANAYTAEAEYKKKKEEADKAYGELKLKYASFKVDPIDFSGSKSSSSSKTDNTDYWKKEFDDQLATLKHQLAMNQITEAQYYNTLDNFNKKYFANRKEYLSEYRQYEEEVYKGLLSVQKDSLDAINDLIDLRKEMIKDMKEDEIDALEDIIKAEKEKLNAINKSIDARKKAIELLKDEKDHDEEMAEKNKAISDIQVQLDRLALDNSASAQKKKRKLEEELAEKKKDLADYITDYEYDKAMESLDDEADIAEQEYEQLEENLNNQIDAIETYLNDEKQLLIDATNDINGMNETLFTNMKNWAYETTGSVQEVVEKWKEAQKALELYNATNNVPTIKTTLEESNYENKVVNNSGGTNTPSTSSVITTSSPIISAVGGALSVLDNNKSTSGKKDGKALLDEILINKKESYKINLNPNNLVDRLKLKDKDSSFSARSMYWSKIFGGTYTGSGSQNTKLLNYLKSNGYKSGTKKSDKEWAWTQEGGGELIRTKDGAILTPLDNSMVFNNEASMRLWEFSQDPSNFIKGLDLSNTVSSSLANMKITPNQPVVNIGDININGDMGNLTKSELNEFRKGIVNDVYESMQKNRVKSGRY